MKKIIIFSAAVTFLILFFGLGHVYAAPSILQSCTSGHYSATASCTLTNTLSAGTTLVAAGYSSGANTTLSLSGCGLTWTNVFSDTTSPSFSWNVWTASSSAGTSCSPSQTTNASQYNFLNVLEVSGINGLDAAPADKHASGQTGIPGGLVTTNTNGDLLLFVGFLPGSQFTYSNFSNGYAIYQQQTFTTESGGLGSNVDAYLVQGTSGQNSTTYNLSSYTSYADSLLIPFKASSSGAPSTSTLTLANSGNGSVVSSPSGINCGSTCSMVVTNGTQVTLTATPTSGYTTTWSNCGGTTSGNTCTITVNANTTVNVAFTPPDTTPPSTPTNLQATAISSSQINLSWTPSTDNVGVTGYKIYRGGTQIGTAPTNSYSDSGLTASTQYTYTVSAYDAAGNTSAQSASASATTQTQQQGGTYPWSGILDPSRAIDWSTAGFAIPNYSTPCATQPMLTANSPSSAAANATAIQNALNSCDATHNVVNLPAGTYYVDGITFGSQGNQVLRGAGGSTTYLDIMSLAGCGGIGHGVCMIAPDWTYDGASNVLPPSGSNQCTWTAGYAQGTTNITLSNCGGMPPLNKTLVLDQANDTSDTGGVYICDGSTSDCTYEGSRNANGRTIGGNLYSNQQLVYITGVTSLGGGSYSVTISPGLYMTNIRSSQNPGAWWPGFVQHDGLENMTIDMTNTEVSGSGNVGMFSCYQCWVTGSRLINGYRNAVWLFQSMDDVIRSDYFYQSPGHAATSYTIEPSIASSFVVENNIFQQVTTPYTATGGAVGGIFAYNFAIKNIFADGSWMWPVYVSHSAGDVFDLFEGNDAYGIAADNASGPADQITSFRNLFTGYQPGTTNATVPFTLRALTRNFNIIGNILGQPSYSTNYQGYALSTTTFTGATGKVIYDLGGGGTGDVCALNPGASTLCDPLTYSTLMRWGNYDVVNGSTQWNSTEASPAAVSYVNANFTSSYFSSLMHALPASLYYNSEPSWWPTGKAWPPVGPDVSSGNVGICSGGTYAGAQATASGQCTGGTLISAWANHANSIPAQDCYLNVMGGPPDGTGNVLAFDATTCYPNEFSSGSDTTPPTVSITSPSSGATVSSTISVSASASDNVGVTQVQFYLDGSLQTTDASSPYTWSWNTTSASNGTHTLSAKAYDAAGNVGVSSNVSVTVQNPITPPSIPTGLVQTGSTTSSIALSWNPSTPGTYPIQGYKVYRNSSQVSNVNGTSFADTNLTPSTTYSYAVSSYDTQGTNSNASSPVNASTLPQGTSSSTPSSTPSISSFSANPGTIAEGQASTLSWVVGGNPPPVLAITPNIGQVSGSSVSVSPSQTTTYTLTAQNSQGSTSTQTTVTVVPQQQQGGGGGGGGGGSGSGGGGGGGGSSGSGSGSGGGSSGGGTVGSSPAPTSTVPTSSGDLEALLQSLLAELQALIKELNTQLVASFTRNLTIGSSGQDVKNLQMFLNDNGDTVASSGAGSPGNEVTYFGAKTQAALAKWQQANGITPASGFLGPKTREYMEGRW